MRLSILAAESALLFLTAACQSRRAEPDPKACMPSPDTLSSHASAEKLAGAYRLRLVATDGPKAGQAVEGMLRLEPYDSNLRAVTVSGIRDTAASYVLYGSADVDLAGVEALRLGTLESVDPMRPGVLVIERKGTITLRLGSEANRRDLARFDGGFTALRVGEAAGDRFAGSWASGVRTQRSGGYFCATRVEDGR